VAAPFFDGFKELPYTFKSMEIRFSMQIFKEGRMFVARAPELDVSSCAGSEKKAEANLLEAVRLFLEEAFKMGTLKEILEEAGFVKRKSAFEGPKPITTKRARLQLP
jgi:hypothetical protein